MAKRDSMVSEKRLVPLLTINEAAFKLGLSRATIYRLIRERALPVFRVGQRYRFKQEDVDELIDHGRILSEVRNGRRRYQGTPRICPHCGRERCRIDHSPRSEWMDDLLDDESSYA